MKNSLLTKPRACVTISKRGEIMERKFIIKSLSPEEILKFSGRKSNAEPFKERVAFLKQKGIIKNIDDERMFAVLEICNDFSLTDAIHGKLFRNNDLKSCYQINMANQDMFVALPEAIKEFGQRLDDLAFAITKACTLDKQFRQENNDFSHNYFPKGVYPIENWLETPDEILKNADVFYNLDFARDDVPKRVEKLRNDKLTAIRQKQTGLVLYYIDSEVEKEVNSIKAGLYKEKLNSLVENGGDREVIKTLKNRIKALNADKKQLTPDKNTTRQIQALQDEYDFYSVTPHDYLLKQLHYEIDDDEVDKN